MHFTKLFRSFFVLLGLVLLTKVSAGEGKISGYMFGDFYYTFSDPDTSVNGNGFQFRRVYFTYDRDLSETFSVRFRLEMNSSPGEKLTPFIKHAYLAWKNLVPNSTIYFGAQSTPLWQVAEKVWGYRSIAKNIMDFRKIASSSDLGLGIKGKFNESGSFGYHALLANGEGKDGEDNEFKKVYISFPIVLMENFQIAPSADYEGGANDMSKRTLALFAGMTGESLSAGVQVFQKTNAKAFAGNDLVESGFSVFGSARIAEQLKGFARFDMFDPNTDMSKDGISYIIAGIDYQPEEDINIMPNIRIESYEAGGKDNLITGLLTFYYRF